MTVEALIEKLNELPSDLTVVVAFYPSSPDLAEVTDLWIDPEGKVEILGGD